MSASATSAGAFKISGDLEVTRLGYGAMRITGEGIWGPPKDHDAAIAVLERLPEFTDAEWATMQAIFPDGVCDFSRLAVDQQPAIAWQTYQDDRHGGAVIYGGKPLGRAPANSGEGWTSPAFAGWLKLK